MNTNSPHGDECGVCMVMVQLYRVSHCPDSMEVYLGHLRVLSPLSEITVHVTSCSSAAWERPEGLTCEGSPSADQKLHGLEE